jgi:hypothetical protein
MRALDIIPINDISAKITFIARVGKKQIIFQCYTSVDYNPTHSRNSYGCSLTKIVYPVKFRNQYLATVIASEFGQHILMKCIGKWK